MTLTLVVRQTLRESLRNREFPSTVATCCLAFGIAGLLAGWLGGAAGIGLPELLLGVASLTVPFLGLQLGYETLARRREDGRLRLLLAQPVSRPTLLAGSYLAKFLVLGLAICLGLVATMVGHAITGEFVVPEYVVTFAAGALLLGTAYVGLSVGASAASRTTRSGNVTVLGCYLLFLGLWRILPHAIVLLANEMSFPETFPPWVDLVAGLSPSVAFERLFGFYGVWFFEAEQYTSTEFSVAVLLGWALVLPAVGLWRFVRTDL